MSSTAVSASRSRRNWLTLLLPAAFLALCAAQAARGFYNIFQNFAPYDDEGYIMLTVKRFLDGHRLYAEIFSQYGPFYYMEQWSVFRAAGLPVTHDVVRLMTLLTWLGIALVSAWAVYRATKSVLLAAVVQCAAFGGLHEIIREPGHPAGLCGLLVVAGMLLCCYAEDERFRTRALAGLGIIASALALTKVNLGGVFGLSLGMALLAFTRWKPPFRRAAWIVSAFLCLAVPFGLTRALLNQPWVMTLAAVVAMSSLSVVVALANRPGIFGARAYTTLLGTCCSTLVLVVGFMFVHGTSPAMLLRAILLEPWHWVGTFVVALPVPPSALLYGMLGLGCSFVYGQALGAGWIQDTHPRVTGWSLSLLKLAFALAVLLDFSPASVLTHGTPFVCLALLSVPGTSKQSFWRVAWCFLAVLQALQSYPVAGTDASFAMLPTMLVAAVCLSDVAADAAPALVRFSKLETIGSLATGLAVLALAAMQFSGALSARASYLTKLPLDLPGGTLIRLPPAEALRYQALTADLRHHADIFVGLPGVDSFYFWAQQEPPTERNLGYWMAVLSDEEQQRIIGVLEKHPRAAVIYSPELVRFWSPRLLNLKKPLVCYIATNFHTVDSVPRSGSISVSYQFLLRNDTANDPPSGVARRDPILSESCGKGT